MGGGGYLRPALDLDDDITTPSGYLKQFTKRQPSNWIMVVLEPAGVGELDRGRPIKAGRMAGY